MYFREEEGRLATDAEAHVEWHMNSGVPMGTPGCPQDACHPDDYPSDYPGGHPMDERVFTMDDWDAMWAAAFALGTLVGPFERGAA